MSKNRRSVKISNSKKRRKRIFRWVLLPILLLALGGTGYAAFLYKTADTAMKESYTPIERVSSKRATAVNVDVDNTSVLFIGVDDSATRGFSEGARSDALLLATFNKKAKSVKLVSIPRDSYVYIPSLGYEDKITHAHANGGPASTIETVENLLDIPVDFYVKVNFNAFIDIVDALDGVDVDVPFTITEQDSHDRAGAITLQPGLQTLSGEEALAFSRTRHIDNDIERGKRQQQVLKAIISKAISAKSITKYSDVIKAVGSNMETDLSFDEMKSFFDYAAAGTGLQIDTLTLEGEDMRLPNSRGQMIYYYKLDDAALSEMKTTLQTQLEYDGTELGQSTDSSAEATNEAASTDY